MDKQLIERLREIATDVGKNYCSPDGDLIENAANELARIDSERGKEINNVYESVAYRRMQTTIAAQSAALAKAREALASAGNTLREVTLWQKPCVNDVRLAKTALPAVRDGIAAIDALGSAVKDSLTAQSADQPEGEKGGAR